MMPPSAQPPRTQTPPLGQVRLGAVSLALFHLREPTTDLHSRPQPPQLGLKTNPPPIQEKPQKTNKKPPPAREELLKMTVS